MGHAADDEQEDAVDVLLARLGREAVLQPHDLGEAQAGQRSDSQKLASRDAVAIA